MTREDSQHILRALEHIKHLSKAEYEAISALGLPVYESLVLAYLRVAAHLFERDSSFSMLEREQKWSEWEDHFTQAVEGAMRYRENEPLVVAIGVFSALMPSVYPHAFLRGFKAMEDALHSAQRTGTEFKRERMRRRRISDMLSRVYVWVGADGEMVRDGGLSEEERASLTERRYRGVWGVACDYHRLEPVIKLVRAVLPITSRRIDSVTILAPTS